MVTGKCCSPRSSVLDKAMFIFIVIQAIIKKYVNFITLRMSRVSVEEDMGPVLDLNPDAASDPL
jgi:hypothetical protein